MVYKKKLQQVYVMQLKLFFFELNSIEEAV